MKHALLGVLLTSLCAAATACRQEDVSKPTRDRCPKCPKRDIKPIRALILGDRTGHPDDDVFVSVLRKAERLSPDLIISVGDLIQGYQPDDEMAGARAEWEDVMGRIRSVFGETMPVFATAGNHDIWSDASEAMFETVLGHPRNFSFEMGDARIILFDTSRAENETDIDDANLDWLVKALFDARRYRARIVVTHRPLFALNPGGEPGDPLHDVLIAGNATYVLSGHWHHAMAADRDGIRYRMIGPSGALPNRAAHPETGNFQQFGWLVVTENGEVDLSLLDAGGVHRGDAFPYAFNQMEYKIERRAVTVDGFELDPLSPATRGRFQLDITNVTDQRLSDTLSFNQANWRITPATRMTRLAPGEAAPLSIAYTRDRFAPLFPGPVLSLSFPFPTKAPYRLQKELVPTLVRPLPRCKTAPRLDGDLDEPCWQSAARLGDFNEIRGDGLPKTEVRVARLGGTLFIGARIAAPPAPATEGAGPRDTYVESGDHFLVLVKTDLAREAYLRIAVDPAGTVYDRRQQTGRSESDEHAWNRADAAVSRTLSAWTAEIAVPLDEVGRDATPARIGFNFSTAKITDGKLAVGWWQPLLEHNRDAFGVLGLR